MKTSELSGAALDWAVAKCVDDGDIIFIGRQAFTYCDPTTNDGMSRVLFSPAYNWFQGGPIIEREKIKVAPNLNGTWLGQIRHEKDHPRVAQKVLTGWTNQHGPSPLIAAMRCYVASKLGDDVAIPKEIE